MTIFSHLIFQVEGNCNLGQAPILNFFELSQESLLFLDSLRSVIKPAVEWSPLPGLARHGLKTLVLDLDETLVHSSLKFQPDAHLVFELSVPDAGLQTVYVKIRPFLEQFLR